MTQPASKFTFACIDQSDVIREDGVRAPGVGFRQDYKPAVSFGSQFVVIVEGA